MTRYNVLFKSGRVLSFYTLDLARMYVVAYNATLLPTMGLDKTSVISYNGGVENDEKGTQCLI